MQQIREFLNFLDYIVATFWGITVVELIPILASNGLSLDIMTSLSDLIKLLFSVAGLIYLFFRIIHYVRMSKINVAIRKQELKKLERENGPLI
jgi:uncharacterized membrane protein YecN with MAPEG domain